MAFNNVLKANMNKSGKICAFLSLNYAEFDVFKNYKKNIIPTRSYL